MKDIPIIFSAPMVRALLDGRKTMTRRLAWRRGGKPASWQRVQPGDRLWVREGWRWNVDHYDRVCFRADYPINQPPPVPDRFARWRSPLHLERRHSRITLVVTATKIERLQDINADDAWNEGVERKSSKVRQMWLFGANAEEREQIYKRACIWEFEDRWKGLHGPSAWDENPEVVALTFQVHKTNIDAMQVAA